MNPSLDFGKVVEKSFSTLFSNAPFFLALSLLASLPTLLVQLIPIPGVLMMVTMLSWFWSCILQGTSVHFVWRRLEGHTSSLGESLVFACSRAVPLFITFVLNMIWVLVGFLLLIIPGILWAVHMLLGSVAVILEGRSGSDALRRSKELVYVNRSKFANVAIGLPLLLCIPVFAFSAFGYSLLDVTNYQIFSLVSNVLTTFLFQSFGIALVVMFLGLRERQEGVEAKSDDIGFTPFSES